MRKAVSLFVMAWLTAIVFPPFTLFAIIMTFYVVIRVEDNMTGGRAAHRE
jgi:isoprenylcysteine carboxyl methyltransferase (ICMT) family protein YpbQ